jgi:hypothetical protein
VFRAGVELVTIDVVATGSDGAPQKLWPVTLGRPVAKGLWRVALSLNAPLPRGRLEVQLLHDGLLLHDHCLGQFTSQ